MIEYLKHMAIFSKAAETESFTDAARSLGIAPSRVSESVSRLEHYVDAALFKRTTRKVALTSEGRKLYAFTSKFVDTAQQGVDALKLSKSVPSGTLKVSLPSYFTHSPLLEAIGQFSLSHPGVEIALSFTNHHRDPSLRDSDIFVLVAEPRSSRFAVQELFEIERGLFVGRDYFARQAVPQHPKDLEDWDWITFRSKKRNFELSKHGNERVKLSIDLQSRLQSSNFDGLHYLAKMNLGVTVMPVDMCRESIRDGSLIRLFDDWSCGAVTHYAVWPENTRKEGLTSVFVDFLAKHVSADA
ncbi:MAG: LysR family transcriptional regulator [Pseudomonadota bacterium]